MNVILDASVAVAWFAQERRSAEARLLATADVRLVAPALLLVEVAHAFLKRRRRGTIAVGYTADVLSELRRMSALSFTETDQLVEQAAAITERTGHPIYDCLYLALARRLEAPLATFDDGMATAAARLSIPLWTAPLSTGEDPA